MLKNTHRGYGEKGIIANLYKLGPSLVGPKTRLVGPKRGPTPRGHEREFAWAST